MRNGIFFSIDAALAVLIVIILAGWITVQFNAEEEKGSAFESLQNKALDRAIMGFYTGETAGESIGNDAEFGECAVFYAIDPNNGAGQALPNKQSFCEELP